MKLSGVALPSCCPGSSQRGAMLVCHAKVILPVDVTLLAAASALRKNGAATPLAARAADCSTARRVSVAISVPPVHLRLIFFGALTSEYTSSVEM